MMPAGLLNVLGLQLPVILVAYQYGSQVAGWFGLTQRVVGLPVTLIGTAVAQVYLGEFVTALRSDRIQARALFKRATIALAVVGSALLIFLVAFGPWTFRHVFGLQWSVSGDYARALAPGIAGQMVASPLSSTLIALERQRAQFIWDATRVTLIVTIVLTSGRMHLPPLTTIWMLSAMSLAMYVISWGLSRRSLYLAR